MARVLMISAVLMVAVFFCTFTASGSSSATEHQVPHVENQEALQQQQQQQQNEHQLSPEQEAHGQAAAVLAADGAAHAQEQRPPLPAQDIPQHRTNGDGTAAHLAVASDPSSPAATSDATAPLGGDKLIDRPPGSLTDVTPADDLLSTDAPTGSGTAQDLLLFASSKAASDSPSDTPPPSGAAPDAAADQQEHPGHAPFQAGQVGQEGDESAPAAQAPPGRAVTSYFTWDQWAQLGSRPDGAAGATTPGGDAAAGAAPPGSAAAGAAAATAVEAAAQGPPPSAEARLQLSENAGGMLRKAEGQLFGSARKRDLAAGVAALRELAGLLDQALPTPPKVRRRYTPPPPPPPPSAPLPSLPAPGSGEQDSALAATAAVAAAPAAAVVTEPVPPPWQALEMQGTGMEVAGKALFTLAALRASGLLADEEVELLTGGAGAAAPAAGAAGGAGALVAAAAGPPPATLSSTALVLQQLHRAGRAGSAEALLALSNRFMQGDGVDQDGALAFQFAKQAAAVVTADVEREGRFAVPVPPPQLRDHHLEGAPRAEDAENAPHVVHMDEDMALRGNPEAQRRMAYRRLMGRGVPADLAGAYHDFAAAAQQGDAYAIFNVGYMHLRGMHVAKNHTIARQHFEASAALGLPSGWNGLGVLHWTGDVASGIVANTTAAFECFVRGAALNSSDALFNLGTMHMHGLATPRNETRGVELLHAAERLGHWRAPYTLALAYEEGRGLPEGKRDLDGAWRLLQRFFAQRTRWSDSIVTAARALDDGDHWGALVQFALLAEQGSATAAANGAWMLQQGLGYSGPSASDMAYRLLHRAAKLGLPSAMVDLGHLLTLRSATASAGPATATEEATAAAPAAAAAVAAVAAAPPLTDGAPAAGTTPPATADSPPAADAGAGGAVVAGVGAGHLPLLAPHPPAAAPSAAAAAAAAAAAGGATVTASAAAAREALAWYSKAAEAGSLEGAYHMGWAHQAGLGTPRNAVLAGQLYSRALVAAGKSHQATVLRTALVLLRMEQLLEWPLGPSIGARAAAAFRSLLPPPAPPGKGKNLHPPHSAGGRDSHGGGGGSAEGDGGFGQGRSEGGGWWDGGGWDGGGWWPALEGDEVDNLAVTALLGALALVLWMRSRSLSAAARQQLAQRYVQWQAGQAAVVAAAVEEEAAAAAVAASLGAADVAAVAVAEGLPALATTLAAPVAEVVGPVAEAGAPAPAAAESVAAAAPAAARHMVAAPAAEVAESVAAATAAAPAAEAAESVAEASEPAAAAAQSDVKAMVSAAAPPPPPLPPLLSRAGEELEAGPAHLRGADDGVGSL